MQVEILDESLMVKPWPKEFDPKGFSLPPFRVNRWLDDGDRIDLGGRDFKRIFSALKPDRWFVSTIAGEARPPFSKKMRNWEEKEDCFVLDVEWTDENYCYENSWFVYPDENRIIKVEEVDRIYDVKNIVPLLDLHF